MRAWGEGADQQVGCIFEASKGLGCASVDDDASETVMAALCLCLSTQQGFCPRFKASCQSLLNAHTLTRNPKTFLLPSCHKTHHFTITCTPTHPQNRQKMIQ